MEVLSLTKAPKEVKDYVALMAAECIKKPEQIFFRVYQNKESDLTERPVSKFLLEKGFKAKDVVSLINWDKDE